LAQQEIVMEVVDSRQVNRFILRAVDQTSRAYGKIFTLAKMPEVVVMAARLEPPPSGQTYRITLRRPDGAEIVSPLAVNQDGFGLTIVKTEAPGPRFSSAHLSLVPEEAPSTGARILLAWNR
jgi:hypothetical protein